MTHLLLVSLYVLISLGFVVGTLIDNDDIPNAAKVLMVILSSFLAPLLLGVAFGMIIIAKVRK